MEHVTYQRHFLNAIWPLAQPWLTSLSLPSRRHIECKKERPAQLLRRDKKELTRNSAQSLTNNTQPATDKFFRYHK